MENAEKLFALCPPSGQRAKSFLLPCCLAYGGEGSLGVWPVARATFLYSPLDIGGNAECRNGLLVARWPLRAQRATSNEQRTPLVSPFSIPYRAAWRMEKRRWADSGSATHHVAQESRL